MLIESIIQRPMGTKVELRQTYFFLPDADGRHVAEVEDEADIATLLGIKEGFRPADGRAVLVPGALPDLEGPFFILRGPQDAEALRQWMITIPEMQNEPAEFVKLTDKIAFGEASLGGYSLLPDQLNSLSASAGSVPPALEPSPPAPADITWKHDVEEFLARHPAIAASEAQLVSFDAVVRRVSGDPANTSMSNRAQLEKAYEIWRAEMGFNTIIPTDQSQQASPGGDQDDAGDPQAAGDGGGDAAGGVAADTGSEDQLDREALAKLYDELFGHRPNGKWGAPKIKQLIDEKLTEG